MTDYNELSDEKVAIALREAIQAEFDGWCDTDDLGIAVLDGTVDLLKVAANLKRILTR